MLFEKALRSVTVSSDTEEYRVALEKIVERLVEGLAGETTGQQSLASPQKSRESVILETGEDTLAEKI